MCVVIASPQFRSPLILYLEQTFKSKADSSYILIYTNIYIFFWQVKKSIFASPESVNGKVGVGTCGIADKPMTQYNDTSKYNVRHLMPQWLTVLFVHIFDWLYQCFPLHLYIYIWFTYKKALHIFKILMLFSFVVTMEKYMEFFFYCADTSLPVILRRKGGDVEIFVWYLIWTPPRPHAQMYRVWIRMCILTTSSLFCCL